MSVDKLLSRLERIRKTGKSSWIACCPSHADRTPSLSIRELGDGRVLLHCFAGCEVQSVLDATALTFADLFPERLGIMVAKRERRPFNAADVLRCLAFEAAVLSQYATMLAKGEPLTLEARNRLLTAAARFQHGVAVAHA